MLIFSALAIGVAGAATASVPGAHAYGVARVAAGAVAATVFEAAGLRGSDNFLAYQARIGRGELDGLAQLANLVHAVVAGPVDLEHVQRPALANFLTAGVLVVELDPGPVGAIQALGKDAGDGGFPGAAGADEQVGMGDPLLPDRIDQRLGDMVLADHIGEPLWAVLARYYLIRHCGDVKSGIARVTTADAEQTTVAAFLPWRGS